MAVSYEWRTDTYTLTDVYGESLQPVDPGDLSIAATINPPRNGVAGITLTDGTKKVNIYVGLSGFVMPQGDDNVYVEVTTPVALVVLWTVASETAYIGYSYDEKTWTLWPDSVTMAQPTEAGMFTLATVMDSATFKGARIFSGAYVTTGLQVLEETEVFDGPGEEPDVIPPALTPSQENVVHALVAAPFGDLEFDVGKSVRWTQWFVDDVYVTDVNTGSQRYWVINWSKSFPEVNYGTTGVNFFIDPVGFRRAQWAAATKLANQRPDLLYFDEDDWVLFVDAFEGLSADNTSLPDDYYIEPFRSYMYREIARANAAGRDRIILRHFVYLRHDHIQNVQYDNDYWAAQGLKVEQSAGVPYYLPYNGLTRLFKVSVLRDPAFDWSLLNTPVSFAPDVNCKLQLVSYGYAHWNNKDIEPPQTVAPELTAENDQGWQQRCMLSQVLAVSGLPVGSPADPVGTWQPPNADPAGVRGPWAFDTYNGKVTGAVIPQEPPPVDPAAAGVLVPLYDTVFRYNMRDGVWYQDNELGSVPLVWDENRQQWVAAGPVREWEQVGA